MFSGLRLLLQCCIWATALSACTPPSTTQTLFQCTDFVYSINVGSTTASCNIASLFSPGTPTATYYSAGGLDNPPTGLSINMNTGLVSGIPLATAYQATGTTSGMSFQVFAHSSSDLTINGIACKSQGVSVSWSIKATPIFSNGIPSSTLTAGVFFPSGLQSLYCRSVRFKEHYCIILAMVPWIYWFWTDDGNWSKWGQIVWNPQQQ